MGLQLAVQGVQARVVCELLWQEGVGAHDGCTVVVDACGLSWLILLTEVELLLLLLLTCCSGLG